MPALVQNIPLWGLIALFALSAAAVWLGGSRLAGLVDALTTRTGMGQAFTGMLLLGGVTSLPEAAAVSTSAAFGNAPLAVNNLLGTASINVLLLALADVIYGRDALTRAAARPAVLIQGVLSMILAALVALIAAAGDVALFGVGAGATLLAFAAVGALWLSSNFPSRHTWEAMNEEGRPEGDDEGGGGEDDRSTAQLASGVVGCGLLILGAGFVLSTAADALAQRTGLAAGLVGFVLVGFATSLPEVSSVVAAVRLRRYQMAIGDVFGTNIFNVLLIFLADIIYRGPPVLAEAGRFEVIGAILAVLMTGVFVVGLLERRDRTILRMGYDALAAILLFAAGLALLARSTG